MYANNFYNRVSVKLNPNRALDWSIQSFSFLYSILLEWLDIFSNASTRSLYYAETTRAIYWQQLTIQSSIFKVFPLYNYFLGFNIVKVYERSLTCKFETDLSLYGKALKLVLIFDN